MPSAAEQCARAFGSLSVGQTDCFHKKSDDLLAFIGDSARLVAHNASFDFGFLNMELERCGQPKYCRDGRG